MNNPHPHKPTPMLLLVAVPVDGSIIKISVAAQEHNRSSHHYLVKNHTIYKSHLVSSHVTSSSCTC